ncbi:MAG: hypothetical protein WBQ73_01080, partial [Candidatus Babeliales bacterium]
SNTTESSTDSLTDTLTDADGCPIPSPCSFHPTNNNFTVTNINETLECNLVPIAKELGISLASFHDTGAEDIRAGITWRHTFLVNQTRETWPEFLVTPFARIEGSAAVGKKRLQKDRFGLSFGSDFDSICFSAGINLDFTESVEFGGEVGVTHFFPETVCSLHIPTSEFQTGLYPFAADAYVAPGENLHFTATMTAYNFLEKLTFHFQYALVQHRNDSIALIKDDPAFLPACLEQRSTWKSQVANIGFNYELSPHISLGFAWQAPLQQLNAFKSTALLFSFNAVY